MNSSEPATASVFDLGVLDQFLGIATYAGVVLAIAALFITAVSLTLATTREQAMGRLACGVIAAGVSIFATIMLRVMTSGGTSEPDPAVDTAPPIAPQVPVSADPTTADGVSAGGDTFNPIILLVILGVIGVLVLLGLLRGTVRRLGARVARRQVREQRWAAAKAVYAGVLEDYAEYLNNPFAWLERPILEDLSEPSTAAFIEALGAARDLDLEAAPASPQLIEEFHAAARTARAAWDEADRNARRIGVSIFEDTSRSKLRKAASSLRTALDEGATTDERAAALDAVARLTDGLVDAPDRILGSATKAIEAAERKALPAGRPA